MSEGLVLLYGTSLFHPLHSDQPEPTITNPLQCFVTAWCVANSSTSSRWSPNFENSSIFLKFLDHLEQFGYCSMKQQHGTIVGIYIDRVSKYSPILPSLSSFFPYLEYFSFSLNDIPIVDVTHLVPLFSSLQNLVSLKVLLISIKGDEGVLPAVTIPPQHCPSLSWVGIDGRASSFLFQSLVFPNIKTLTILSCPLPSSDLSSLCTGLCQTTSLKMFQVADTDLTTHEAKELASALEQNRSLEGVFVDKDSVTITDDGFKILRQVLSNHPTVKNIKLPYLESDHSSSPTVSDDDDLHLAMSLSLEEEEQKRKMEEEELQQVLSLSLVDQ